MKTRKRLAPPPAVLRQMSQSCRGRAASPDRWAQLMAAFPWGTDEPIDGAEVVDMVNRLRESAP